MCPLCATVQEYLDHPTTINLMSGYDRMDDVLYFCELTGDFERIVSYHVQNKDAAAALAVLLSKDVRVHAAFVILHRPHEYLLLLPGVVLYARSWRRNKQLRCFTSTRPR